MTMRLGGLLLATACLVLAGCSGGVCNRSGAEKAARNAVLAQLKAPSTATFSDVSTLETGPHEYTVIGFVDAENSFGAKLRNRFSGTISCTASDSNYIIRSAEISSF